MHKPNEFRWNYLASFTQWCGLARI